MTEPTIAMSLAYRARPELPDANEAIDRAVYIEEREPDRWCVFRGGRVLNVDATDLDTERHENRAEAAWLTTHRFDSRDAAQRAAVRYLRRHLTN